MRRLIQGFAALTIRAQILRESFAMKKILCTLLALAILFPAPLLRAADSGGGKQVKVIMKDGSIVSGEMLGVDDGVLMLQTKGGKSKEISVDKIKKVFDA